MSCFAAYQNKIYFDFKQANLFNSESITSKGSDTGLYEIESWKIWHTHFQRRNLTENKNSSFENFSRIDSFESG
jgi:hypothetical protein